MNAAKDIMIKDKGYVGFSITAGHPSRVKEFKIEEIIKLANHLGESSIPTFFIEEKFVELKKLLKSEIKNAFFPEEFISDSLKKPMMLLH